ncbi:hypothetical protein KKB18_05665 [bacterium]|nr:hypothetical protein [bacterium]
MEKIKKKCQKAQKSQCRKARASFFVDKNDIENEKAYIRGSDVRHIKKVLRLKKMMTLFFSIIWGVNLPQE